MIRNAIVVSISIFVLMSLFPEHAASANASRPPQIPVLEWQPRSDWASVKSLGAVGDGRADDTPAIQKALDGVQNGSVVYLPPGTYRVTKTLTLVGPLTGVLMIGHGQETTLVWDGAVGGNLFADDGVAYSRFVGMRLDGQNKAAVGFHHDSDLRFETEVRHQHMAFVNFTDAGILAEPKDKFALAETLIENCLFENCRRGMSFTQFNDYDITFDGCEFRRCETGIVCAHGNFYVRNCHFEESRSVDIDARPEHGSSVRRCTSVGSNAFLRFSSSVAPMTIQDCHVSDWKDPTGTVVLGCPSSILFDCTFARGPRGASPIHVSRHGHRLIGSEIRTDGAAPLLPPDHKAVLYPVPRGRRKGSIRSAHQQFLKDAVEVPTKVFDARRDFGAKADGSTDDTASIQQTIDAAREHGNGAIAYLPGGTYAIGETLKITGSDYVVGGSGWSTRLRWTGAEGGTILSVHDPQQVTLEHMAIGSHDVGNMNNGIDIHQTGSGGPSRMTYDGVFIFGMYQKQPFRKGLHLTELGPDAVVLMPHVQGNLRLIDSAEATILANVSYEGSIVVEGKSPRRDGFLGFLTRLCTLSTHALYLKDNQNIVVSDFYVEQADNGFVFEGDVEDPPGRATIQGAKIHFTVKEGEPEKGTAMKIHNYGGEIFFGHNQFYNEPRPVRIVQQGRNPLTLYLIANCFYNVALNATKEPAAKILLIGNQSAGKVEPEPNDDAPPNALKELSRALDDLRRLGDMDLELNHPDAMPRSRSRRR